MADSTQIDYDTTTSFNLELTVTDDEAARDDSMSCPLFVRDFATLTRLQPEAEKFRKMACIVCIG